MPENEVKVRITADSSRFVTEMNRARSSIDNSMKSMLSMRGILSTIGISGGLATAWRLAETAAQFEEMKAGLQGLSAQYGMTADDAVKMAKAAVGGQLSMMEAGQLAAKAFMLGFDPAQVETFLIAAEKLTDVVGGKIPEAFGLMEKAAVTGRSRALAELGINVDLKKAILDYANAHGIAVTAVSAHNATQIRAQAIMAAVKKVTDQMGESTMSTADKMNVMRATVADINLLLGQGTIRAASGGVAAFQALAAGALLVYEGILRIGEGYYNTKSTLTFGDWSKENKRLAQSFKADADAAFGAAAELSAKATANLSIMTASTTDLGAATKALKPIYEENGNEMSKQAKAKMAAERELYKDLRGYTTAYYEVEKRLIENHADDFRNLKLDEVAIAAWTEAEMEKLQVRQAKAGDDMLVGMKAGWDEWARTQAKAGAGGFELTQKAIKDTSDALAEFVMTGKADFASLANSIIKELIKIQIQQALTGMFNSESGGGGGGFLKGVVSFIGGLAGGIGGGGGDYIPNPLSAKGNIFNSGNLIPFARGGIVTRPTIFPMARGMGLMGEAGHEAIMPLARLPSGDLGVKAAGSGGGGTNITIVALDSQSFHEYCKRNPGAIMGVVNQNVRDRKVQDEWRTLLR